MEGFEPLDYLDEDSPDVLLAQISLLLLVARNLLKQIPIVRILHNYAKNKLSHYIIRRRFSIGANHACTSGKNTYQSELEASSMKAS